MSTDSDMDDDELLQMALKEQAQRDLNYGGPSAAGKPSKAVVNLVHALPPFTAVSTTNRPNPKPRAKPPPLPPPTKAKRGGSSASDDDVDSEVDMLIISSGDEEKSSREIGVQPRARRRRASRDDGDLGDDGEEPRTWKRVDEGEALAHQYSSELLEGEFERTRLNIACFVDSSLQPCPVPIPSKLTYSSCQGSVSSPNYRRQQTVNSPGFSRRLR